MSTKLHFVKAARQDHGDIKKGESYFWWKFRYGGKRTSKTRPKPSQLENSPFISTLMGIEEMFDEDFSTLEDLESTCEDAKSQLEDLQNETQEKFDNMPEGLQQGDTGQLLEERVNNLQDLIGEFDSIDFDKPDPEDKDKGDERTDEEIEKELTIEKRDEINGFNWSF